MQADHRHWGEIAEELGRSVHAVKARLRKLEARQKRRKEREDEAVDNVAPCYSFSTILGVILGS